MLRTFSNACCQFGYLLWSAYSSLLFTLLLLADYENLWHHTWLTTQKICDSIPMSENITTNSVTFTVYPKVTKLSFDIEKSHIYKYKIISHYMFLPMYQGHRLSTDSGRPILTSRTACEASILTDIVANFLWGDNSRKSDFIASLKKLENLSTLGFYPFGKHQLKRSSSCPLRWSTCFAV